MNYFAHIDGNTGKVYAVSESQNNMVPAPSNDARLIGTTQVDGQFIGYRIALATDKPEITANGTDAATITATVTTWDDQPAADFTDDIIFEVEGQQVTASPENGVASIQFDSQEAGTYVIKTVNEGYVMQNGQVEVKANA